MDRPIPLVFCGQSRELGVNYEALQILKNIDKPVVVVAVAGFYRTGKSYIMNRLFGETKGFKLGSTVQSETKGIWMWCRPHPMNPDRYLVLLDTEGLSDPEEGDAKYDMAIFSLAVLLSSCFIYNSTGAINQHSIDQLHLVSKLTEHIKVKSSAGDESGEDFDQFFPSFIWVARDFTLEKIIDGKEVTSDEYLEHCLKLKKGRSREVLNYNLARSTLKEFFKTRRCFTMPRPCAGDKLSRVEELEDSEINAEFLNTTTELIKFIYEKAELKTVNNQLVTGSMLGGLAESYIDSISRGGIPCIESAVKVVSDVECQKAVRIGTERYLEYMEKNLRMPTTHLNEFTVVHEEALKLAIQTFLDNAVFDDDHNHQKQLQEEIDKHYERLDKLNIEISQKKCVEFLETEYEPIKKQVLRGFYLKPGGYKEYLIEREKLKTQYHDKCKWLGADTVYAAFVKEKMVEQMQIMSADKQLSDAEREKEQTNARLEEEKMRAKAAEEENQKMQEEMANAEKTFKAHAVELEKKYNEELQSYKKEQDRVLENRLKNQEELLRKGFVEEANLLKETIGELRSEQRNREERYDSIISDLRNTVNGQKSTIDRLQQQINSSGKGGGGCFAASSGIRVQEPGGQIVMKKLSDVNVGDWVESVNEEHDGVVFSLVYFIAHFGADLLGDVLEITVRTRDGTRAIRLDENHLIYAVKGDNPDKRGSSAESVTSGSVELGDILWVKEEDGSFSACPVTNIYRVYQVPVLHPMTMNHKIVVNDVWASVHMFHESTYRALTSPLRMLYWLNSSWCQSALLQKIVTFWDSVEEWFTSSSPKRMLPDSPDAFWERLRL